MDSQPLHLQPVLILLLNFSVVIYNPSKRPSKSLFQYSVLTFVCQFVSQDMLQKTLLNHKMLIKSYSTHTCYVDAKNEKNAYQVEVLSVSTF